jgi:hypothetical protein
MRKADKTEKKKEENSEDEKPAGSNFYGFIEGAKFSLGSNPTESDRK